ncbi:MAG: OmpA family protein [Saprospiraceae bacterium]|nr:OmpA family protein [Saprospiraceae bacterium]
MIRSLTVLFLVASFASVSFGQDEPMRVERASAINPDAPVYNIYVDKEGEKWVSNAEGLWQVHAADLATPVIVGSAEESLLNLPGGNADIRWVKGAINDEIGGVITGTNEISCAFYNEIQDHLWIGTTESGVYLFRTQPKLKWIKEINKRMPKLRSEKINMIYVDGDDDRHFIGTDEGVIAGRDGRWGLEERYFRFQAVANRGKEIWLLSEDIIWVVSPRDEWSTVEIDPEKVSGPIKDIAFDKEGKLWIASEYLTMFDVDSNRYKVFDGGDYFTSNNVNCIAVDPEGAVWVGTQDKGLYVIEKESAMTVTCLVDKELSCDPNIDDASLIVKIKGGQPPYTYQWDQGLSGDHPQNLAKGKYLVTVTDSRGQSKVAEGEVPDTRLKLTLAQTRPHTEESRGAATATVEGGKPKFTFLWDNGEIGPQAERLEAGEHGVTVTDVNGCKTEASLTISRDAAALAANITKAGDDRCATVEEQKIQLNVTGGIEPYTIAWSDPKLQGNMVEGLKPGTYFATITDAANNSVQASINLPEVEVLNAVASQLRAANPDGKEGSGSVEVSGSTGRLKYQWDNGESKAQAENLEAGNHTVTITDQNGCTTTANVEITQETAELSAQLIKIEGDKCAKDDLYAIQLNVSGGAEPYIVVWSDAAIKGNTANNLKAGTYFVTVTDSENKKAEASINLEEREVISATASQVKPADLEGSDGSGLVEVAGAEGRIKYQWDNGESKARAQKLSAGSHSVTVTDDNGCTATATVEITQEVQELALTLAQTSKSKCAGDGGNSLKAMVAGGMAPYTYQWSDSKLSGDAATSVDAGVYQLTVTDDRGESITASVNVEKLEPLTSEATVHAAASANNKDGRASVRASGGTGNYTYTWSNGETSREANALAPGTHQVTVTDAAGCVSTSEVEISENISEMSVVLNLTNSINCNGEKDAAVEAVVRGGKSPFTYSWSDPGISGDKPVGLASGAYEVTVSDVAGNTVNASIDIVEPEPLEVEIIEQRGVTDEASKDGRAQVKVSGGSGTYTYLWDNQFTGEKAENLSLGAHEVTVTDGNGCEAVASFETKQKILPQLTLSKLRSGQVVQMQMLQFDADSTNVNDAAEPILDEVYDFLKDNPSVVIRIEGHTNNVPKDDYCDMISTARAKSVAEYIVQHGIAGERVYYRGYGKRQPLYSNLTPEGRRKNQRVEIKILNIGDDDSG